MHLVLFCIGFAAWTLADTISERTCLPPHDIYDFCNSKLDLEDRLTDLIKRIKDEDKAALLTARGSPQGKIVGLPYIGVPAFSWGLNCIHGIQSTCVNGTCPTSFPNPNAMGATFDDELATEMWTQMGQELRPLWLAGATEPTTWTGHAHIGLDCWSPNININRDPRWGRNAEVPSEDPVLTSALGIAYTIGLQQGKDPRFLQGVSTLKHWAAYSLEDSDGFTRHNFNAVVQPHDLADTYLPAWKASILQANAKGVMCSYNAVNGEPACASKFLKSIMRDQWNFTGYITSDTDAVADIWQEHKYTKTAATASCRALIDGTTDIDSGSTYFGSLLTGVKQGDCAMSDVDRALRTTMRVRFQLGLFDPIEDQPYWNASLDVVGNEYAQNLSQRVAAESFVMLKNDQNTLPFAPGKTLAVIGPHSDARAALVGTCLGQLCPSGYGNVDCVLSPLDVFRLSNKGGQIINATGCTVSGTSTDGFAAAVAAAKAADQVIILAGSDQHVEAENHDRTSTDLPGVQHDLIREIMAVGKPTALVLINGGSLGLTAEKEAVPAIVLAWYPGIHGAKAIVDAVFGVKNIGGKLPVTFYPAEYTSQITMSNMNMTEAPGRSYKYYTGTPLWPFGHGLSYTTFSLAYETTPTARTFLTVGSTGAVDVPVVYRVNVTNTGKVAGDEVVMAFFSPKVDTTVLGSDLPLKRQVFGFRRVRNLAPGASLIVEFSVSAHTVLRIDRTNGDQISIAEDYTITFTNGVDQHLTADVSTQGRRMVISSLPL